MIQIEKQRKEDERIRIEREAEELLQKKLDE